MKYGKSKWCIIPVRNYAIFVVDFDPLSLRDAVGKKNDPIVDKGGVRIALFKGLRYA